MTTPAPGSFAKVFLPGESPWAEVIKVNENGTWIGRIANRLFAEMTDAERDVQAGGGSCCMTHSCTPGSATPAGRHPILLQGERRWSATRSADLCKRIVHQKQQEG